MGQPSMSPEPERKVLCAKCVPKPSGEAKAAQVRACSRAVCKAAPGSKLDVQNCPFCRCQLGGAQRGCVASDGYFACPGSTGSAERDRRVGRWPTGTPERLPRERPAPDLGPLPHPGSGPELEMRGACGTGPLSSAYGNFPESGKFPAFPGSSPPSDT